MAEPTFGEEFQRLVRALIDSLDRESELQRQLRRTKESLVAVALRLQVAIKVTQEDEYTIGTLQQEVAEARTNAIVSNRQAAVAAENIAQLNLEISSLKRRLRAAEKDRMAAAPNPNLLADAEVDSMMNEDHLRQNFRPDIGGNPASATPFNRWKIEQFLYSPDTPAASESHDKYVVDMLAATLPCSSSDITRPTKISIAKTAQKNYSESKLMASVPSGKGEVGVLRKQHSHASNPSNEHFLDPNFPFWGDANRFEKDNLGRVNLWTTLSHDRVAEALLTGQSPGKLPSPGGSFSLPSPFRKDQLLQQQRQKLSDQDRPLSRKSDKGGNVNDSVRI